MNGKEVSEEKLPAGDEAEAAASALTTLSIHPKKQDEAEETPFEIPERFTKSGRRKAVPFPVKLMKVLSDKKFSDIIAWTPSGMAFSILDPKAFTADILPEHFKSAKFSSFNRKLHRWGFARHFRGKEAGAYYHKDFQKDRLDLAEQMTCKLETQTSKSTVAIAASASASSHKVKPPPHQMHQPMIPPASLSEARMPLRATVPPVPVMQIPVTNVGHGLATSHLDIAIEAEVARRVQERLQQATLSRMFMQQQLNTNAIPLALRLQLIEMQQKKLNSLGGPRVPLAGSNNPTRTADQGLGQLPRSNVQGAKTA